MQSTIRYLPAQAEERERKTAALETGSDFHVDGPAPLGSPCVFDPRDSADDDLLRTCRAHNANRFGATIFEHLIMEPLRIDVTHMCVLLYMEQLS